VRSSARTAGFVLVEVCVAMFLLVACLLPVMGVALSVSGRTTRLDDRARALSASGIPAADPGAADWTWGPRPGRVTWVDGPVLQAELDATGAGAAELIGVWVDGWFLGESSTEDVPVVVLGTEAGWRAAAGREVVVRARRRNGPWGAPFRTLVPGLGEEGSESLFESQAPTGSGDAALVMHVPSASPVELTIVTGGHAGEPVTTSIPLPFGLPSVGPAQASCCSIVQAWMSIPSRALDVYF
jgi:hypothetical protein